MKYIFTVHIYGKPCSSKPLTYDELMNTITAYIANGIGTFEVKEVEEVPQ